MKGLKFFVSMLIFSFMFIMAAFCGDPPVDVVIDGFNPEVHFVSLAALVSAVLMGTQFFKKILGTVGGWTVVLSGVTSMLLSLVGWKMQWGIFLGIEFYWALAYGIIAALVANRVFDLMVGTWLYQFLSGLGEGNK